MINSIKYIILLIIFIYLFYGCVLYYAQDRIIFYPVSYNQSEIEYINKLSLFKFKKIEQGNKTLSYWERRTLSPIHIFYFGGNAENTNYTVLELINRKEMLKYNWYILNYPGYNGSSGKPSEKNFYLYAEWLYQEIKNQISHHSGQMIFMGRSIGSGVAVYLATRVPCDKLILITPFDSIENLAKRFYPLYPVSLLLKHKFPSHKYIQNYDNPILILIAEYDEIVPRTSTENLVKNIKNLDKLKVYVVEKTSHNTISETDEYWKYLNDFISENKI